MIEPFHKTCNSPRKSADHRLGAKVNVISQHLVKLEIRSLESILKKLFYHSFGAGLYAFPMSEYISVW